MSTFNAAANSQAFNIVAENELSEVLSHYSSEFIFSILDRAMESRFTTVPLSTVPNVVVAWEQNFKAIIAQYGQASTAEVTRVRNETYREIIDTICREFGLNFTIDEDVDLYTAAVYLYSLFVNGFIDNMCTFFANYIFKQRSSIYDSMNLQDYRKNKDSSTIYGRRVFKDIKFGIVSANIDLVISQLAGMDFKFHQIINTIYDSNSDMAKYILSIVSADNDFFARAYLPVLNSEIHPEIITNIRFKLQEIAISNDQIVANINE